MVSLRRTERRKWAQMLRIRPRIFLTFLLATVVATRADAQFGRRESAGSAPKWWLSAWGGYQWGDRVTDPKSNADWLFDQSWSTRFTIEREIAPGTSAGIAYNYSRMPLRFGSLDPSGSCRPTCKGDATMASYGLTARSGMGGRGVHLVYEGFIGAVQYSHFTLEGQSPAAVAARSISNTDFAYGFGIGVGYALSRDWEWLGVFDTLNGIHERADGLFGQRNSRHYQLRTGVRLGVF